jgi:hypothetical protein
MLAWLPWSLNVSKQSSNQGVAIQTFETYTF